MKFLSLIFIFFMSFAAKADVNDEYARYLTRLIEQNNLQTTHLERALESLRQNKIINPVPDRDSIARAVAYEWYNKRLPKIEQQKLLPLLEKLAKHFEVAQKNVDKAREATKVPWKIKRNVVAAGGYHTCAVKADSTVDCWGDNSQKQLNVPSDLGEVQSLAAGNHHTCAVKADRTVACWGSNIYRQLNFPSDLGQVQSLAVGSRHHTCAVKADSSVACWGDNSQKQLNVPSDLGQVQSLAAGGWHTCAVKADSSVACWGMQLNVPSYLGQVQSLAAGEFHTCTVKADSTVACWGDNEYKQLDVPSDLGKVQSLAAGNHHTCAVKADRTVACWRSNQYKQLNVPKDLKVFTSPQEKDEL